MNAPHRERVKHDTPQPTHLDAVVARSVKVEEALKEIGKLNKSVRDPKGQTLSAITVEMRGYHDLLGEEIEAMDEHAAAYYETGAEDLDQLDLVRESRRIETGG